MLDSCVRVYSMSRLKNKVALITGGGTGIGRACALAFAREGAHVALAGRRPGPLHEVEAEIAKSGAGALAVECDVTDGESIQHAVEATAK